MERDQYEEPSHCRAWSARTREGEHLIGTGIMVGLQGQLNVAASKTQGQQTSSIQPPSLQHSAFIFFSDYSTAFKAFKIHETIQNWHHISWGFSKLATAGQESVITLHQHCLWMQHIPRERGRPCTCNSHLHTACPVPTAQCFLPINPAAIQAPKKVCSIVFYLLPFPSWLLHGYMWALRNILTTTKLFISTTTEHT